MLHVCDQRFDVTENLEIFCQLNKASVTREGGENMVSRSNLLMIAE